MVTKYRREVINQGVFAYFEAKLAEITGHYPQIKFREVNHDKDHIHLLVSIPPTMRVGKAIGIIKANTAKGLKQKFRHVRDTYWGTDSVWSESNFVSTVGANEAVIKKYIQEQGKKDLGQALFKA